MPSESQVISQSVAYSVGGLLRSVNRNDRKQLIERPVIRHRAKHRKVRQILGAQQPAQIVKLFRNVFRLLRILVSAFANVPEQHFALGAIFERDQARD